MRTIGLLARDVGLAAGEPPGVSNLYDMPAISNTSSSAVIESVLAARQAQTQSNVSFAVAGKSLDAQRAAGDAAIQLLEAAAGQGQAEGRGLRFDAVG